MQLYIGLNKIIKYSCINLSFVLVCSACTMTPRYNLVIKLTAQGLDEPKKIEQMSLNCSPIPNRVPGKKDILPSSPESWCGAEAIDPKYITNGENLFYFHLEPNPQSIDFVPEPSPSHDSPLLYFSVEGTSRAIGVENHQPDVWSSSVDFR